MTARPLEPGRRIAIIGSGIAGLTAAHFLRSRHDVTVFEAGAHIGGHTNTIEVEDAGRPVAVDTGFIVYNERNYPNFTRLLSELGVATQPSTMSFSVRDDRDGLEYNGSSLNQLFVQRRNLASPRFLGMLRDIARFNADADRVLAEVGEDVTVERYVSERGFGRSFARHYLEPIGSSIWSSPTETFRSFPIRFVVEFFRNHGMLQLRDRPQWRVIAGGSARYVEKLTAGFRDRIRLRTPVLGLRRSASGVELELPGGERASFDHTVVACHSDQALRLLRDPTPVERELLGAFPCQTNRTVLHTDTSLLPRRRRAWGGWNHHTRPGADAAATLTYNMNMLQSLRTERTYCVTLNEDRIDRSAILRELEYDHPIYLAGRTAAQARHAELQSANRTSYCGAYWGYGFHEDGVVSALRVCRALGWDGDIA